jgi:hypothetical protein
MCPHGQAKRVTSGGATGMIGVAFEAIGGAELVTKAGLQIALRDLDERLIVKIGGMLIVTFGVIVAALRFLPATYP